MVVTISEIDTAIIIIDNAFKKNSADNFILNHYHQEKLQF